MAQRDVTAVLKRKRCGFRKARLQLDWRWFKAEAYNERSEEGRRCGGGGPAEQQREKIYRRVGFQNGVPVEVITSFSIFRKARLQRY